MARAIDVADFIIQRSEELGHPVTNLELQKYMYFCQAKSLLIDKNQPLIQDEDLQKWKYGPVSPTAYHTYKRYGVNPIPTPDTHTRLNTETWQLEIQTFDIESLTEAERIVIEETIPKLFTFDRFALVEETHRHQSWLEKEEEIMNGSQELQYDNEEIYRDFNNNTEFQIWTNN